MPVRSFMRRVDDIDWYCQQQGDGPAVVLVPSGEGDCTSFDAVAELLADQFMVLTFDMPGFSRTSAPVDKISMFKAADQIAALVRSLNIDTATFYGCSSGGIIVLSLIAGQTDLVTNGIVHEVAFGADYRDDKSEPLLPGRLPALADDEVVEQCKMIFREYMNEDQAAWDALGEEYHARLARNYLTWVRRYFFDGPVPALEPRDFTKRPVDWTIGGLTPAMVFFSNVQLATSLGISVGLLPCKHFPQVSVPKVLADHIRSSALRHLA